VNDLASTFLRQADICRQMHSPVYASLLTHSAEDLAEGGAVATLVAGWQGHPVLDNLPLRWMGALHELALAGRAPDLARQFPSTGGRFDPEEAWPAALRIAKERADEVRPLLADGIQTNEVMRCCALAPGALRFAAEHGLPLRLLEIGASAGLNLCMDRYRYQLGERSLGPPEAELLLSTEWRGAAAPTGELEVAERKGCDLEPIDVRDPARRRRLLSFVWPDQSERRARLEQALAIVAPDPPALARRSAGDWLAEVLVEPRPGLASLLFQSVMWWYVPEAERTRIVGLVESAGGQASAQAPLGWLRMEPPGTEHCELRLRSWPGGHDRLLARVHFHGRWVEWLDEERP
jgi:hypothetical protein